MLMPLDHIAIEAGVHSRRVTFQQFELLFGWLTAVHHYTMYAMTMCCPKKNGSWNILNFSIIPVEWLSIEGSLRYVFLLFFFGGGVKGFSGSDSFKTRWQYVHMFWWNWATKCVTNGIFVQRVYGWLNLMDFSSLPPISPIMRNSDVSSEVEQTCRSLRR